MSADITTIPPLVIDLPPNPGGQVPAVPARDRDEDDTLWLERRVNTWKDSVRAAAEAALDIARNWIEGRQVGRFYPDQTVYDFLSDQFGAIRLPPVDRNDFIVKLVGSGLSARKAARLAGVSNFTASAAVRNLTPRRTRKRRSVPVELTDTTRLVREIDTILGTSAMLPEALAQWLATEPDLTACERVSQALGDLRMRLFDLDDPVIQRIAVLRKTRMRVR